MSRIATGTGDEGRTGLFGGQRVRKDHHRVEAYGAVDELNSALGLVHAASEPDRGWVEGIMRACFVVGADLATPGDGDVRVTQTMVDDLDAQLDELEAALPPLRTFILPGGSEVAARLHHARAVCRRAERRLTAAMATEEGAINPLALVYLNRLADLLFLKARARALDAGGEVPMDFEAFRTKE